MKNFFLIVSFLFLSSCTLHNLNNELDRKQINISLETPSDRYNIIFKEKLKRLFNSKQEYKSEFILKTSVSFNSTETLSVGGLNVLQSTIAVVTYSLNRVSSGVKVKSGSIKTFPALSSSSKSLYSGEKSIENIKERLSISSANKLYLLLKVELSRLN